MLFTVGSLINIIKEYYLIYIELKSTHNITKDMYQAGYGLKKNLYF